MSHAVSALNEKIDSLRWRSFFFSSCVSIFRPEKRISFLPGFKREKKSSRVLLERFAGEESNSLCDDVNEAVLQICMTQQKCCCLWSLEICWLMEPSAKNEGFLLGICGTVGGGSAFEVCQRLLSALVVNPLTCTGGLLWMPWDAEHMRILKLSTATKTSDKTWSSEAVGVIVLPPGNTMFKNPNFSSYCGVDPSMLRWLKFSRVCVQNWRLHGWVPTGICLIWSSLKAEDKAAPSTCPPTHWSSTEETVRHSMFVCFKLIPFKGLSTLVFLEFYLTVDFINVH